MILKLLALNVVVMLGVFALVQAVVVAIYCRYMRPAATSEPLLPTDCCAVLIALRGADQHLYRTLFAHLQQRDVTYHLHLIVDSIDDPAVSIIYRLPAELSHLWTLHVLELNSDRCSLKCLALSQVARQLLAEATRPKFLAFADGDGLVSRDWLRRMLDPMVQKSERESSSATVGATTGHRWYRGFEPGSSSGALNTNANVSSEPCQVSLGAIIRYFWNLGSLPQMHLYRVVWGGSWAIRADVLERCGLIESWEKSLFEDTQVRTFVEAAGQRVVTAPGVLVQSYEPLGVAAVTRWISRQLLDMRLYHPSFPLTAFHAGFLALLQVFLMVVAILMASIPDWSTVGVLVAALMAYQLFYAIVWWNLERTAQLCLTRLAFDPSVRLDNFPRVSPIFWAVAGLLLTQVVYPWAAVRAMLTRAVSWRGIHYRIVSPTQVQRLNYEIYRDDSLETRSDSL